MKYEVYQMHLSDKVFDEVNRLGHAGAAKAYPEYEAYQGTHFAGSKGFKSTYLQYFSKVAEIEAQDLEQVFEIGNGYGDQTKIARLGRMHSVSVGDIVVADDGRYMMVDRMGFNEVSVIK